MKKIVCGFFLSIMLVNGHNSGACGSGGPGAVSCSLSTTITVLGVSTTRTSSVTCGDGYYACCTSTGATCEQTKKDNNVQQDD